MLDKLQGIIRRYSDDDNAIITGSTAILSDLGMNSFELVELICEIEEAFGVEIPDRAINGFKTVQNVLDYLSGLNERKQ